MGVENRKHMWDYFRPHFFFKKGNFLCCCCHGMRSQVCNQPWASHFVLPTQAKCPFSTRVIVIPEHWLCILISLCSVAGWLECSSWPLGSKRVWHGHFSHGSESLESCGFCRVAVGDGWMLAGYSSVCCLKLETYKDSVCWDYPSGNLLQHNSDTGYSDLPLSGIPVLDLKQVIILRLKTLCFTGACKYFIDQAAKGVYTKIWFIRDGFSQQDTGIR